MTFHDDKMSARQAETDDGPTISLASQYVSPLVCAQLYLEGDNQSGERHQQKLQPSASAADYQVSRHLKERSAVVTSIVRRPPGTMRRCEAARADD